MGRHEVDRLGGRELRRDRQVALVLAIGRVDDDDEPALPDVLDRLLDGRERRHFLERAHAGHRTVEGSPKRPRRKPWNTRANVSEASVE